MKKEKCPYCGSQIYFCYDDGEVVAFEDWKDKSWSDKLFFRDFDVKAHSCDLETIEIIQKVSGR